MKYSSSLILVAALFFVPASGNAQTLDGAYRGMFVCQKMPAAPDILRVPLDVAVKAGNVQFARPIFNWNGQRVIGNELGAGTIDAEGKIHLTSNWHFRGITYQGDYTGTLTADGGTLLGTHHGAAASVRARRAPAPQRW